MKASTETLRKQNRGLVLSALRRLGAVSHTEISEWTGLSSATVTAITHELEHENVIVRVEQTPASGRGRPRIKLIQNANAAYIAAVRITSELVQYSLVDYAGALKDRFEVLRPADEADVDTFCQRFIAGLKKLAKRSELSPEKILMISITTKGLVAQGKAELSWSPVFENQAISFERILSTQWPGRILLTNDTQFTSQSIMREHSKKPGTFETRKLAALSLGHSIGLGVAQEDPTGRIHAFAPPFGHMVHEPGGPKCRCGTDGCIESYAGFYGILRTAFGVEPNIIPAKFIPFIEIEKIAVKARQGDHLSEYAFRMAGEAIGIGLGRLLTILGPMPIAITGPGVSYYDLIEDAVIAGITSNLQIRQESLPDISLHMDEGHLIFDGNVQACLTDLDNNVLSERKN